MSYSVVFLPWGFLLGFPIGLQMLRLASRRSDWHPNLQIELQTFRLSSKRSDWVPDAQISFQTFRRVHVHMICGKVQMGAKCFIWFQMVPDVSIRWFQIAPDGSKWLQMVPNALRWFEIVPDGFRWLQMVPDGFK